MSKKHFDAYFNDVADQYKEMIDQLKEMEEGCNNGIVSPDALDNMKKLVEPIKNNYLTLSWVMFLLNKPNRAEKKRKYENIGDKLMNKIDPEKSRCPDAVKKENKNCIDKLKEVL